jgi:hypothetical protein
MKHMQVQEFGHADNVRIIHSCSDIVFDFTSFLVSRNVMFHHCKLQVQKKIHIFDMSIRHVNANVINYIKLI